ncbi:MAG: hypothetical protein O7E52_15290 [Candidatus Poribacteria bacterium]|nr:hypothetical protein [Candidatus Poribacteria bacterium]
MISVASAMLSLARHSIAQTDAPIEIGNRLELFVDDYLIDEISGATRTLHAPQPQEVACVHDNPWEGSSSGYKTVFQDGDLYRMYYRGSHVIYTPDGYHDPHPQVVCYAESHDGIHWTKPELGLIAFDGDKQNNIIWEGVGAHNFAPFKDANPDCKPDEKYKALGSGEGGLYAFKSADGIHWSLMKDQPVITRGAFDSQNLAFWDTLRGEYREYHRDFREGRDIRTGTSRDFLNWSDPVWLEYAPERGSELYTNQVIPYYRAPHIFLGFPTRYIDRGWSESTKALPQLEYRRLRGSKSQREGTAVTDGMFMSSRDGYHFDIWPESFIRPGLRLRDNWFYGDNYQNWGLVETKSHIDGAPDEISIYASEASHQGDDCRWRRFTLRVDGFVSVQAPLSGGEFVTKPLIFEGAHLAMNFSTSAAGSILVEIQDESGNPIPGFGLDDCPEVFGDALERVVPWKNGTDVSQFAGRPIRLRFVLADANLYSIRFC